MAALLLVISFKSNKTGKQWEDMVFIFDADNDGDLDLISARGV